MITTTKQKWNRIVIVFLIISVIDVIVKYGKSFLNKKYIN